jgi:hypothetical protein
LSMPLFGRSLKIALNARIRPTVGSITSVR